MSVLTKPNGKNSDSGAIAASSAVPSTLHVAICSAANTADAARSAAVRMKTFFFSFYL